MLVRVTIILGLLAVAVSSASADTICLKNGRKILVDHVRENGSRYEYEIGESSFAIPKSSVDHIETGGMPASSTAAGGASVADLPAFAPADSLANEGDLVAKIIREGKVDTDALSALEGKGNAELSATANFIAGKFDTHFLERLTGVEKK